MKPNCVGVSLKTMSNYGDSEGLPTPEEILGLSDSRGSEDELCSGDNNGRMGSSYSGGYGNNGNGNSSGAGKRGLPKLREILRRQRPDSEVGIL